MDLQRRRFRIAPTGDFASPADIATVESRYLEPPITLMLYNRQPAIGISITILSAGNASTSPLFGIKLSDEQVVQITESDHNNTLIFQSC